MSTPQDPHFTPASWPCVPPYPYQSASASPPSATSEEHKLQLGGLVHENKDFCGRENKIVAICPRNVPLGGHDGQFDVSALEKGHSDGQPLTEIDSRGWTKGTKQRNEPFGAACAACFERLAGVLASRVAC